MFARTMMVLSVGATLLLASPVPTPATTIEGQALFTDNRLNDLVFGSQGYRLHLEIDIRDPLGVPSNIQSVTSTFVSGTPLIRLWGPPSSTSLGYSPFGNVVGPVPSDFGPYIRSRSLQDVIFLPIIGFVPRPDPFSLTYSYIITPRVGSPLTGFLPTLEAGRKLPIPSSGIATTTTNPLEPRITFTPIPNADRYQVRVWDSGRNLLYVSPLTSAADFQIPTGLLKTDRSYTMSTRAFDLDSGGRLENRSTFFFPFQTPAAPIAAPAITGSFDRTKPTVIITHGLQEDLSPSVSLPPGWVTSMRDAILARTGGAVNVVVFVWPDAYRGLPEFRKVKATAYGKGPELANLLESLMGSSYTQPIHFIGHSYGNIVNAEAIGALTQKGKTVTHVTILDAPSAPITGVGSSYFADTLSVGKVTWVDNYFGTVNPLTHGEAINGAYNVELGGASHPDVHAFYEATIRAGGPFQGFEFSREAGGFDSHPLPSTWSPGTAPTVTREISPTLPSWFTVGDVAVSTPPFAPRPSVLYAENSNASFFGDLFIPDLAKYLTFELEFGDLIDGDFFSAFIDDIPLFMLLGQPGLDAFSGFLPIDGFAGAVHRLSFTLHGVGEPGAELRLSQLQFVERVPMPATLGLLLAALGLLILARRIPRAGLRVNRDAAGASPTSTTSTASPSRSCSTPSGST